MNNQYRIMPVELSPAIKDAIRESGCPMPETMWAAIIARHDLVSGQAPIKHWGLLYEAKAVFDLMLQGCALQEFGDYQNGEGETIGPRMDALHAALGEAVAAFEQAPIQSGELAPPNSLPDWSECNRIIENHEFRERAKAGLEGQVLDTTLTTPEPTELHRFIYEYDDSDSYKSAWFMHRLEKLLTEVRAPAAQQQASTAPAPVLRKLSDVMRKDPMSPEDFGLNGEHANKARAYHTAMMAEAAQEQAAVVPAGWKLVPVKPTEDMVDATNLKIGGCYSCAASIPSWEECAEIYADMLAAAPAPPVAQAHALTDAEIDAMARKANLDGSMLIGHRSDYWRAFARDLIAHLTQKA